MRGDEVDVTYDAKEVVWNRDDPARDAAHYTPRIPARDAGTVPSDGAERVYARIVEKINEYRRVLELSDVEYHYALETAERLAKCAVERGARWRSGRLAAAAVYATVCAARGLRDAIDAAMRIGYTSYHGRLGLRRLLRECGIDIRCADWRRREIQRMVDALRAATGDPRAAILAIRVIRAAGAWNSVTLARCIVHAVAALYGVRNRVLRELGIRYVPKSVEQYCRAAGAQLEITAVIATQRD